MQVSSKRFKAVTVCIGISFWFFLLTSVTKTFSLEIFIPFVIGVFVVLQIISAKLSLALDWFAIANTKVFLGIIFVLVISIYGVIFKILRIDLLRLSKNNSTYWLERKHLKRSTLFKQY